MTLTHIRDWYAHRNGTSNGIPVMHVSANIVHADYLQSQCDEFVNDLGITVPANDYGPSQTNAVHDLFAFPNTKPVFAIINCVSNSPSHRYNELLLNQLAAPGSGTQSDWDAAMVQWRALIDSIQAPPPRLTNLRHSTNTISFSFPGQRGRTNQVLVSSNSIDWQVVGTFYGTNGPMTFRDTNSRPYRFYKLRRL